MPIRPITLKPTRVHASPLAAVEPRRRGTRQERGYGVAWQRLRVRYLSEHPLCVHCAAKGRMVAANEVDHLIDIAVRPDLRLDADNLQALCKRCHSRKTRREQNRLRIEG